MPTYYSQLDSPIGTLLLVGNGSALTALYMRDQAHGREVQEDWQPDDQQFIAVRQQLDAYFAGQLQAFDLSLEPAGTEFQIKVWRALRSIPYGRTESYGNLARRIGKPTASRAVGMANGRNPLSIIVPCHRVIGASGALTGYGGGVERKRWLLSHEAAVNDMG